MMMTMNEYKQHLEDEISTLEKLNESLAEQMDRNNLQIKNLTIKLRRDFDE